MYTAVNTYSKIDLEAPGRYCTVYNDGSHYVATALTKRMPTARKEPTELESYMRSIFDTVYWESLRQNTKDERQKKYIKNEYLNYIEDSLLPADFNLEEYVEEGLERKQHNLHLRRKRFRRKAFFNEWNYFTTFTYDDKKHTPESFRKSLKKCLANLHTRRGWKYMVVFELSPQEKRLHCHALMYIPQGEVVGDFKERRDYNKKTGKLTTVMQNSFFLDRFGRNDFAELNKYELENGNTIEYILKYMAKTGEKVMYSRKIPGEFKLLLNPSKELAAEFIDFVYKYVLFDDVFDYDVFRSRDQELRESRLYSA